MYCPNCKEEFTGKFCPECGTKLIEAPVQNDVSLNISDNAAIVGGVNVNRSETHNTTKYVNTVVERQKSEAELMQERKQQFMQCCRQVLRNGLLVEEEKRQLEAERVRLGIDAGEAEQLIDAARLSSGSRARTLGVRDAMTLANINTYIEKNNAKVLDSLILGLSALARNYNVDEILCKYNMLQAALHPDRLICEYEKNSADEYWQTYWGALAYMKCGNFEKAEETIVKLGYFSQYPADADSLLLSAVSTYSVIGIELAKGFVDAIVLEQCSLLLYPFIKALFLEISPERASEVSLKNENCKFYTDYIVSLETPEEKEARRKAEEEKKRKAEEEVSRKAEEEKKRKAEEEARCKAEEEKKRKAEEEARRKAEEEKKRKAEEEARRKAVVTKDFTVNGVYFTMVAVAGGTFNMGSNDSEAYEFEKPVHSVTLSDYYIGETEVTQALWQAVMGSNPSNFKGSNNPVEQVSYNDCIDFINKLNTLLAGQLPAGRKFRLPTEAEWEFAARGGNKGKNNNYKYSGSNSIDAVAWWGYIGNSNKQTHPVKQKQPNELGIYDMTGNVLEWCYDWYDSYSSSPQTNPQGPSSGSYRVFRGGCWVYDAQYCRVASRFYCDPGLLLNFCGLRLAF